MSLAWILLSLGAAERAERVVRDGLRISRRVGAAQVTHYLEAMLIGALLHQRRITEALPILDEVVKIARARGEKRLLGVLLLWRAGLDDEAGVADAAVIDQAREGFGVLGALESSQIFAQASLARLLARHGELAEAVSRARDGLVILGGVTSTLDDEWWIWASFIEVLERAGLDDEADPANREALARIARLRVQIEDPELQRTFAAHPPVVALLERAQRRGLHVATIDAAIA